MKHLQFKVLSVLIVFLLIGAVTTSTAIFLDAKKQSFVSSTKINQLDIANNDPKIETILEMINESLLREYLEILVGYGPRLTGTYSCQKSAEYIYQQFKKMGLKTRYQNWTTFGNRYHPRLFKSQNVEGKLKGSDLTSDKIILFNAHYDTVKASPGANDDGSGTAAVLAAAYVLSNFEFSHTLKFITFSGEEVGTLGSHVYAKEAYEQNDNIMVEINADMIGHAETAEGGRRMGITATEDAGWILDVVENINTDCRINFQINIGEIDREGRGWGDYHPFVEYGYEALACWGGEHDQNMHTPKDDINNVNFSYLVNTTRILAGTLAYLADNYETYPQVRIVSPKFGKLYFEGREIHNIDDLKTIVIDDIWIWIDVKCATVPIERAEFYYGNKLEYTDNEPPFKWHLNKLSIRKHRITVVVYDNLGRKSSDRRDIRFINLLKNR
ncbi:MAG: M28 family peptidase [Thermoplasmatales archaeon]|nr:MAG: M28 family peptidase [Thermoplasmatales archaeon]